MQQHQLTDILLPDHCIFVDMHCADCVHAFCCSLNTFVFSPTCMLSDHLRVGQLLLGIYLMNSCIILVEP